MDKLSAELEKARKEHNDAKAQVGRLQTELEAEKESKKKARGEVPTKEAKLISAKKVTEAKQKSAELVIEGLKANLEREKEQHRQTTEAKKQLRTHHQEVLVSAIAEVVAKFQWS